MAQVLPLIQYSLLIIATSQIEVLLKKCKISISLDADLLRHFNKKLCGEKCILMAAQDLNIIKQYRIKDNIPYVRGEGNCIH